jgi:hypothetical protein
MKNLILFCMVFICTTSTWAAPKADVFVKRNFNALQTEIMTESGDHYQQLGGQLGCASEEEQVFLQSWIRENIVEIRSLESANQLSQLLDQGCQQAKQELKASLEAAPTLN